jgi:hypothetical protein
MARALAGSSIACLRDAISDPNYLMRWGAVWVVGSERHPELGNETAAALYDWHRVVRESAADALVKIGYGSGSCAPDAAFWAARRSWQQCVELGQTAVEPLALLLHDESPRFRMRAVRLLAQLDTGSSQRHLQRAARDEDVAVRRALVRVLPQHRSWATDILADALSDESPSVRRAAGHALDEQDWQPSNSDARAAAGYWAVKGRFDLCAQFGVEGVAALLLELRSGPNADAASEALSSMGKHAVGLMGRYSERGDYWARTSGSKSLALLATSEKSAHE